MPANSTLPTANPNADAPRDQDTIMDELVDYDLSSAEEGEISNSAAIDEEIARVGDDSAAAPAAVAGSSGLVSVAAATDENTSGSKGVIEGNHGDTLPCKTKKVNYLNKKNIYISPKTVVKDVNKVLTVDERIN